MTGAHKAVKTRRGAGPVQEEQASRFSPTPAKFSLAQLYLALAASMLIAVLCVALGVSYIACPTSTSYLWLNTICEAEHARNLVPLLIPVTAWFGIANWVGWEYFRNS